MIDSWREFVGHWNDEFDKTVFHYLLKRLGELRDARAVDDALVLLRARPEETTSCLDYFSVIRDAMSDVQIADVISVVLSDDTVYSHQKYEILRWATAHAAHDQDLRAYCRRLIAVNASQVEQRAHAIEYLGVAPADDVDVDFLMREFHKTADPMERSTVLMALRGQTLAKLSDVVARSGGEHDLVDRALRLVRERAPRS